MNVAASVPPTIAISEFTATRPLILPISWALITLNPNQPTARIQEPSARNGIDEGGCALTRPSRVYRPLRGPRKRTAIRPIQPPTAWTTIDPAKSWKFSPNQFLSRSWMPNRLFQAMPSNSA